MKIKLVVAVIGSSLYMKSFISSFKNSCCGCKLKHVALNSASETGAKMHQNAQI